MSDTPSNGQARELDQPARKTTTYTVLYRLTADTAHWSELECVEATSQAQARRKAVEADHAAQTATDDAGTPRRASVLEMALDGIQVELVAIPNFEARPLEAEMPPPPAVKIRC